MNNNVKKLCFAAIMSALYVGLDFLAYTFSAPFGGTMKISISGLPIILCAVLINPIWAAAAGFTGALIGQMISYGFTVTTLLWVMPAVIRGLSMGLLFILFKRSLNPFILSVETVISSLLVTAANTVVSYIDSKIYSYPVTLFGIILVNRIIVAVVTAIVFALIVPPIVKAVKNTFRF